MHNRPHSPAKVVLLLVNLSILSPKRDIDGTDGVGAAYTLPKVGVDNAGHRQGPVGCLQPMRPALDAVLTPGGLGAVGCRLPLQEAERGAVILGLGYQGEHLVEGEQ